MHVIVEVICTMLVSVDKHTCLKLTSRAQSLLLV